MATFFTLSAAGSAILQNQAAGTLVFPLAANAVIQSNAMAGRATIVLTGRAATRSTEFASAGILMFQMRAFGQGWLSPVAYVESGHKIYWSN